MGSGNTEPPRSAAGGIERNRKFVDSLLEEAVSSEPVSGNPKFPASWENTGKFIDFGL
jgi:hypothetical protein